MDNNKKIPGFIAFPNSFKVLFKERFVKLEAFNRVILVVHSVALQFTPSYIL